MAKKIEDASLDVGTLLEESFEENVDSTQRATLEEDASTEPKPTEQERKRQHKHFFLTIAILMGVFLLAFGAVTWYGTANPTGAAVTIDDLHQENVQGDLQEDQGYLYNGISIVKAEGLWWTDVPVIGKIYRVPLHFGPKELEYIPIRGKIAPEFNEGDTIYVAIDPNETSKYYSLALTELSFSMVQGVNRKPEGSCIYDHPDCVNRTIISCENTQGKPVVELVIAEEEAIELQGTCMKIKGRGTEYGIVKAANRLLYKWFGVMN